MENRISKNNPQKPQQKLDRESHAIQSLLSSYKKQFKNKNIEHYNTTSYITQSKELLLLLTTTCKKTILIHPDKIQKIIDQITGICDGVFDRFYETCVQYNGIKNQAKNLSKVNYRQVCVVCSNDINKVQIDTIRKQIMNQNTFVPIVKEEENLFEEQQDLKFFTELHNLLNTKQAQITSQRIDLTLYKDFIKKQIEEIKDLKCLIPSQTLSISQSSIKWMQEIKSEMKDNIQSNFKFNVSPWIEKMFRMFTSIYEKSKMKQNVQQSTQTDSKYQGQLLELKRKLIVSKDKTEKISTKLQIRQEQLQISTRKKNQIQLKVDYYKQQINSLFDQIQTLKIENQIIKNKLHKQPSLLVQKNDISLEKSSKSQRKSKLLVTQPQRNTNVVSSNLKLNKRQSVLPAINSQETNEIQTIQKIKSKKYSKHKPRISALQDIDKSSITDNRTSHNSDVSRGSKKKRTLKFIQKKHKTFHQISEVKEDQSIIKTPRSVEKIIQDKKTIQEINQLLKKKTSLKKPEQISKTSIDDKYKINKVSVSTLRDGLKKVPRNQITNALLNNQNRQNVEEREINTSSSNQKKFKIKNQELLTVVDDSHNQSNQKQQINTGKKEKQSKDKNENSSVKLKSVIKFPKKLTFKQDQVSPQKQNKNPSNISKDKENTFLAPYDIYHFPSKLFADTVIQQIYGKMKKLDVLKKTVTFHKFKQELQLLNCIKQMSKKLQNNSKRVKSLKNNSKQLNKSLSFYNHRDNRDIFQEKSYVPPYKSKNKNFSDPLSLFCNQRLAYCFENQTFKNHSNFNKNSNDTQLILSIFKSINNLKQNDRKYYNYICSYLRCPYQTLLNGQKGILSVVTEMSKNTFNQYFKQIMVIHGRCIKKDKNQPLCEHLRNFIYQIQFHTKN